MIEENSAGTPKEQLRASTILFNTLIMAMIFYLAACDGAALLSVIGFILTDNYWFVLITAIMLTAMFFKRPTRQRVINELQLNWQCKNQKL